MAYCYFQGSVEEEAEIRFPIQNLGITRGFGVFDLFRMRNGKYSFLQDHLDRFEKSQQFMELSEIISQDEIKDALDTLDKWNGFKDASFKLILFGDGMETDEVLSPLFYIIHKDMSHYEPIPYASVILHEYVREYSEIKTVNYFTSNLLHRKRIKSGAIDSIYYKNNQISEASRSNVFVVKDGILRTPKEHILKGITRKHILQVAPQILEIREEDISIDELKNADEDFISSSLKEVCPIVEVDGKPIGRGKVGSYTRKLNQLFQEKARS